MMAPTDWTCECCGEEVLPICTGCPCCGLERPLTNENTMDADDMIAARTRAEYGVDDLKAENERLQGALKRYGLHTWDCANNDSKGVLPCDCGWATLASDLEQSATGEAK